MINSLEPTQLLADESRRRLLLTILGTTALAVSASTFANPSIVFQTSSQETSMSNLQKIQAFFTAYAAKNIPGVREVMDNEITWTIPGHHPLAGTKHGIDEVLAFFDQLGKANFKAQPLVVVENGDYVIDHHRGWSEAAGGIDLTWCLVFRFEAGKIKEVTNFCADQHLADLFFWKVYQLKPIPARLA